MFRIMLTYVPTILQIQCVYAILLLPSYPFFEAQADSVQSSLSFGVKNALAATSLGQWKSRKSIASKVNRLSFHSHALLINVFPNTI